jgi:uncharacterized membrane protein
VVAIIPAEPANKISSKQGVKFHWTYIVLPLAIFLLAVILTVYFYRLMPSEVAYHFEDSAPDKWMSRGAILAWLLIPQFFLVLVGIVISGGTTLLSQRLLQAESTPIREILPIMGNMVALPQIILIFAMLDIFLYNAYQIHLLPMWIIALIVIILGSLVLGIFFIQALRQQRETSEKSLQE